MPRALSILTVTIALAAALACGSTSSSTVAGPSPAKCQLTATNSTPSFTATGGQGAIAVQAERECAWTAAAQVTWVALMPPTDGQGASTLRYNVQANPSGLPRRGSVNVAGQVVEVGQAGAPCRFELDRARAQIAADVTSLDVDVQGPAGCSWTAVSGTDWLAVTQGAQGSGPGRVTLRALANPGAERVGSVLIAGLRFEVSQVSFGAPPPPPPPPPSECIYTLLPTSAQLDALATEGTVSLATGSSCPWTATSNQPWLSIASAASGTGNAQITYRVAANGTDATRTAQLAIATAVFGVQQAAADAPPPPPPPPACTFTVSPNGPITADAGGATGSIAVTTTSTCDWSAAASDAWIQLTASGGTGTGQVGYQIAPNQTTSDRTATIAVAGTTLTVAQAATSLQPITLNGDVANLSGTCPATTFVLEGRTVRIGSSTNFKGGSCSKLKEGEPVIVRGLLSAEGTVDATELEFVK